MNTDKRPVKVMLSVSGPTRKTNPFVQLLSESVRAEVVSSFFSWRTLLTLNFDVLHLHWPEEMLRGRNAFVSFLKCLIIMAYLPLFRLRHVSLLWTVHNPDPHEGLSWFQGIAYRRLVGHVRYRVYLTGTMIPDSSKIGESVVIPHGHYRSTVKPYNGLERHERREYDFLYFGRIMPYKGVPALLEVFESDQRLKCTLHIAGHADAGMLKKKIQESSLSDPRISSNLAYLDEEELHREIRKARVVVLPYKEMFNSGALLLALSLNRPVVVPRTPTTEELAKEVGSDWVVLYDGVLTSEVLSRSLLLSPAPGSCPDLSQRDWERIGEAYSLAYKRVLAKR